MITSASTCAHGSSSVSVTTTTTTTTITTTRTGLLRKVLDTVIFVAMVAIFTVDTVPIGILSKMCPDFLQPYTEDLERIRDQLDSTVLMRKLGEYGLTTMGPWDMFSEPADENTHWKGIVHKYDGSVVIWKMPDLKNMTSWQLKRHMRLISYFDTLSDEGAEYGQVSLGVYIVSLHQPGVVSLDLIREFESTPDMPPRMRFWDKARQPMMYSSWDRPLTLHARCWDSHPDCPKLAEQGQCDHISIQEMCHLSCALCSLTFEIDDTLLQGDGQYIVGEVHIEEDEEHHEEDEEHGEVHWTDEAEERFGYDLYDEEYDGEDFEYYHEEYQYSEEWDENWDQEVDEFGDEQIFHREEEEDEILYPDDVSSPVMKNIVAEQEEKEIVKERARRKIPTVWGDKKISLVGIKSSSTAQENDIDETDRTIRANGEYIGGDHDFHKHQGTGEEL